jgi:hypothetical protein
MAWPGGGHAVLLRHLLYGRGVKVPERERERAQREQREERELRALREQREEQREQREQREGS